MKLLKKSSGIKQLTVTRRAYISSARVTATKSTIRNTMPCMVYMKIIAFDNDASASFYSDKGFDFRTLCFVKVKLTGRQVIVPEFK